MTVSNCQMLWMTWREDVQAATFSFGHLVVVVVVVSDHSLGKARTPTLDYHARFWQQVDPPDGHY
jgi:hypothetical protein